MVPPVCWTHGSTVPASRRGIGVRIARRHLPQRFRLTTCRAGCSGSLDFLAPERPPSAPRFGCGCVTLVALLFSSMATHSGALSPTISSTTPRPAGNLRCGMPDFAKCCRARVSTSCAPRSPCSTTFSDGTARTFRSIKKFTCGCQWMNSSGGTSRGSTRKLGAGRSGTSLVWTSRRRCRRRRTLCSTTTANSMLQRR